MVDVGLDMSQDRRISYRNINRRHPEKSAMNRAVKPLIFLVIVMFAMTMEIPFSPTAANSVYAVVKMTSLIQLLMPVQMFPAPASRSFSPGPWLKIPVAARPGSRSGMQRPFDGKILTSSEALYPFALGRQLCNAHSKVFIDDDHFTTRQDRRHSLTHH